MILFQWCLLIMLAGCVNLIALEAANYLIRKCLAVIAYFNELTMYACDFWLFGCYLKLLNSLRCILYSSFFLNLICETWTHLSVLNGCRYFVACAYLQVTTSLFVVVVCCFCFFCFTFVSTKWYNRIWKLLLRSWIVFKLSQEGDKGVFCFSELYDIE